MERASVTGEKANGSGAAAADVAALDSAHHVRPFADMGKTRTTKARVIVSGEGLRVRDADGRSYLDAFAGLWCVNVGYGRREIVEAVRDQMDRLPFYNSFFGTTTEPTARLAAEICELAGPGISHVFFTNSGSEANDTWLRLARVYWSALGKPRKRIVIARDNAYHGSTVAGASLGGMPRMHEQGDLPIPGIVHIGEPYWYGEGGSLSPEAFGLRAARELERKIDELGEENVAAFVAEPIQGSGGVIVPPDSYWPEIARICARRDILLVTDEVICGFGRLGSWFGFQHYGLAPDFCPIAKGLTSGYVPMGGVLVSDRVAEVLAERAGPLQHGFTYSGHPVAAAAALANLRILREERLVERIRDDIGPYFAERWGGLADHPMVGEAVSVGLLGAVQIALDKRTRTRFSRAGDIGMVVRNFCMAEGLILRAASDRILVSPAFTIRREEVDEIVATLRGVLDRVHRELS